MFDSMSTHNRDIAEMPYVIAIDEKIVEFTKTQLKKVGLLNDVYYNDVYKTYSANQFFNNAFITLINDVKKSLSLVDLTGDIIKRVTDYVYIFIDITIAKLKTIKEAKEAKERQELIEQQEKQIKYSKAINNERKEVSKMADFSWAVDNHGMPIFDRDGVQLIDVIERGRIVETVHPGDIGAQRPWPTIDDYDDRGNPIERNVPRNRHQNNHQGGYQPRQNDYRTRTNPLTDIASKTSMYDKAPRNNVYSQTINADKAIKRQASVPVEQNTPTEEPKSGNGRNLEINPWAIIYRPSKYDFLIESGDVKYHRRGEFNLVEYLEHELNPILRNKAITAQQIRDYGNSTVSFEISHIRKTDATALIESINEELQKPSFKYNFVDLENYDNSEEISLTIVSSIEEARTLLYNKLNEVRSKAVGFLDDNTAIRGLFLIKEVYYVSPDHVKFCKQMIEDLTDANTFAGIADGLQRFTKKLTGTVPFWWNEVNNYYNRCATDLVRYGLAIAARISNFSTAGENLLTHIENTIGTGLTKHIAKSERAFVKSWNSIDGLGIITFDSENNTITISQQLMCYALPETMIELDINYVGNAPDEDYGKIDSAQTPELFNNLKDAMSTFYSEVDIEIAEVVTMPLTLFTTDKKTIRAHKGQIAEDAIILSFS